MALSSGAAVAPGPAAGSRGRDPRFGVRWQLPGLCPGEDDLALLGRRQTLLAQFQVSSLGEVEIRHPPEVARGALVLVAGALERARAAAAELVDWTASAQPPPVVLYRSDGQLRGVACVNQSAIGYYDGAIHVSVDPAHVASHLTETVVHEYMHHVLNALGVRQPMWLHEGLAMLAAAERWFADPRLRLASWLRDSHLPFEALVTAFPHTADEAFAVATYYQSYMMVQFLHQRRGADVFRGLTRELAAGTLAPERAFLLASGLPPGDLEAAFVAFLRSRS